MGLKQAQKNGRKRRDFITGLNLKMIMNRQVAKKSTM